MYITYFLESYQQTKQRFEFKLKKHLAITWQKFDMVGNLIEIDAKFSIISFPLHSTSSFFFYWKSWDHLISCVVYIHAGFSSLIFSQQIWWGGAWWRNWWRSCQRPWTTCPPLMSDPSWVSLQSSRSHLTWQRSNAERCTGWLTP